MMNARQDQYKEQILHSLISETEVIYDEEKKWYTIKIPFIHTKYSNTKHIFTNYVMNTYGVLFCEVDDLYDRYTDHITQLHNKVGTIQNLHTLFPYK